VTRRDPLSFPRHVTLRHVVAVALAACKDLAPVSIESRGSRTFVTVTDEAQRAEVVRVLAGIRLRAVPVKGRPLVLVVTRMPTLETSR
jgi:hypothetical protein